MGYIRNSRHLLAGTAIIGMFVTSVMTRPAEAQGGEIRLSDRLVTALETGGKGKFLPLDSKQGCPSGSWKEVRVRTTSGDKPWRLCLRTDLGLLRGSGSDVAALNGYIVEASNTPVATTTVATPPPPPPPAAPAAPAAAAPTQPAPEARQADPAQSVTTTTGGFKRLDPSNEDPKKNNIFVFGSEGFQVLQEKARRGTGGSWDAVDIRVKHPGVKPDQNGRQVLPIYNLQGVLRVKDFPKADRPEVERLNAFVKDRQAAAKVVHDQEEADKRQRLLDAYRQKQEEARVERQKKLDEYHRIHGGGKAAQPAPSTTRPGLSPAPATTRPGLSPAPSTTRPGFTPSPSTTRPGLTPTPTLPGPVTPVQPVRPVPVV